MDLKNQRRMAAEILDCGENRVWIDPNRAEDLADAITRADIRTAIESGTIKALPKAGISKGRTRYNAAQRKKGRQRGSCTRAAPQTALTSAGPRRAANCTSCCPRRRGPDKSSMSSSGARVKEKFGVATHGLC